MSTVNFNDTTPTAPGATSNVVWQSDASGNISANVKFGPVTTWTPGQAGGGSMTITSYNVLYAKDAQLGPLLFFCVGVQLAFGGTASNYFTLSLPTAYSGPDMLTCTVSVEGPTGALAAITRISGAVLTIVATTANFALATTYNVRVEGFFPF